MKERIIIIRSKLRLLIRTWRPLYTFILAAVIFLSLVAYFLLSLASVSREEIMAVELKISWEEEPICREECQSWRQERLGPIINHLSQRTDSSLSRLLINYFYDESLGEGFKRELIRIWRSALGPDSPPDFLLEYLEAPNGDSNLKAAIITSFNASAFTKRPSVDAPASLSELMFGLPIGPLSYYFDLLLSEEDLALKKAAVRALSDYSNKKQNFSRDQLPVLGEIIKDDLTDKRLRQSLVMLLGDYYELYSEESLVLLRSIYRAERIDEISRLLAADFLQRAEVAVALAEGKEFSPKLLDQAESAWPRPVVSESAWAEYYQD